jgi:hypothetical protein
VKLHAAGNYAGPVQINLTGALEIFGIGTNGELWHSSQIEADASNGSFTTAGNWINQKNGLQYKGSPTVVKNLDNTLELFVPGAAGDVEYSYQLTPGGSWSGWTDMGSSSAGISSLRAANNADGSLSVFGIGADGAVWYATQRAPGVGWSPWMPISGEQIQPGFVVGQDLNGLLEIVGVDSKGDAWNNRQTPDGGWVGWNTMGGKSLNSKLAIARNLDGRLQVFGVDSNFDLWHTWQSSPGGSWNGWSPIPGKRLKPGFVAGQDKEGRLVLFGVGAGLDSQHVWSLWQQTVNGAFATHWVDMGGSNLDPGLAVGNAADGRIQLFGTGSNHELWSNRMDTGDHWVGWTDFGRKEDKAYASRSGEDDRSQQPMALVFH